MVGDPGLRMVADDLVLVPLVTMDDHGLIGGGSAGAQLLQKMVLP